MNKRERACTKIALKIRMKTNEIAHVRLQCNSSTAKCILRCTSKHTSLHFKGYFSTKYMVLLLKYCTSLEV